MAVKFVLQNKSKRFIYYATVVEASMEIVSHIKKADKAGGVSGFQFLGNDKNLSKNCSNNLPVKFTVWRPKKLADGRNPSVAGEVWCGKKLQHSVELVCVWRLRQLPHSI